MAQMLAESRIHRSTVVPLIRARLLDRLHAAAQLPIALIIAPAGYGKSVLLRQYLDCTETPHVRFGLRAEHGELLGFLRGFAEALGDHAPHAISSLAGAYERNQNSPRRSADLARWLLAHLDESFKGIIAIDDLHNGDDDPDVARFVTALIELSKDRISWIIASRSTSGLPVGSWLAYGDADSPIDEADLPFTLEEAFEAASASELTIGPTEVSELLQITEGWPAALSFALRTSTRSSDLRNISAVTREVTYRFLAEQVYDALSVEERDLLDVALVLPSIDIAVLERAGFDRALETVEGLCERTGLSTRKIQGPIIATTSSGIFCAVKAP
jgi:ATP/maltotriose-dependent transcriptional regulator MalT